jgi:ParB-like chromosome segregation protein Spo0J
MSTQIEKVAVEDLIPYAKNSRTHDDAQVAQVAASIKEFGFTAPVLIGKDNDIIAGHCRVMAARKLGLKEVPCIRLTHLTENQKKAYVIADNRLALNSSWDIDMLKLEIDYLDDQSYNVNLLGFSEAELGNMFLTPQIHDELGDEEAESGEKKLTICPKCHHEFEA